MLKLLADIVPILLKTCPVIASALGGPLSGIAVSLLSSALGTNAKDPRSMIDKVLADVPNATALLQELEAKHGGIMQKLIDGIDTLTSAEISIKLRWEDSPRQNASDITAQ